MRKKSNTVKLYYHYRSYVLYKFSNKNIKALYHYILYNYYKRKEP